MGAGRRIEELKRRIEEFTREFGTSRSSITVAQAAERSTSIRAGRVAAASPAFPGQAPDTPTLPTQMPLPKQPGGAGAVEYRALRGSALRADEGETQHLADIRLGQCHDQPVQPDTQPTGRWHAQFQGAEEILIHLHGLRIALGGMP